jgi:flagellin
MPTFNTNISALQTQHALTENSRSLSQSMQVLSSGLRVNGAADDAAGMAIGSQMAARILSLNQAIRNANDGVSMMQTADGAARTMLDVLARMRELATQAASDTYGPDDVTAIDSEFTELKGAMSSVINNTSWNGINLLDGSISSATYQVGATSDSSDGVAVTFSDFSTLSVLSTASPISLTSLTNARSAISAVETDLETINTRRSSWGAAMGRLTHAADNSSNVSMNLSASKSQLMDADYAKATADLARAQIIQEAGTAMLSQANQQGVLVLHLLS